MDDLNELDLDANDFQKLNHVHEKWTKYFTSFEENELISCLRSDQRFQKMSDCALINVGITTGNNKYFSLSKKEIDKYELFDISHPLIGRSSHANSVFFKQEDWKENINAGKAAFLLDFPDVDYEEYTEGMKMYIKQGEENGENAGYKCRIRDRWYRIPSIWVPDAFFLRRNNLYPKFVLNKCDAVSTDTMHRIKFNEGIEPEKVILSYYNSISFAFTEICGRSYGGGVLEILPGEVGNIIVPILDDVPLEVVHNILLQVDKIVRLKDDIENALDLVDREIMQQYIGIEEDVCVRARTIWKKMQRRRLKRG